jgi:hypothetical protein
MKNYEIEYRDCTSMRCSVEIEALHEKEAIMNLQKELIEDGDYMTQLIDIQEVKNAIHDGEDSGTWSVKGGQVLDQESQDALNDAMSTYTNSSGLTLEQAMERASQRKNN